MKLETILENLKNIADELNSGEGPLNPEQYKQWRTLKNAKDLIEKQSKNELRCHECGEGLVCPKCTPVIEKTNSIIIRYKDVDYNGGYPNMLIITPMYISGKTTISVATITGDNFFHPQNKTAGYTYMERGTIEKTANILATVNVETWCRLFGFPKNRLAMAIDLQIKLRMFLGMEGE